MEGPIEDGRYVRLSVSTPLMAGDGPYLVVRWAEPERDQVRYFRITAATAPDTLAEWCASIVVAELVTGASGVRRVLGALERSGACILT